MLWKQGHPASHSQGRPLGLDVDIGGHLCPLWVQSAFRTEVQAVCKLREGCHTGSRVVGDVTVEPGSLENDFISLLLSVLICNMVTIIIVLGLWDCCKDERSC